MHKYKIEALTHRIQNKKRFLVWANYIVNAANPIEAREQFWRLHPGKSPCVIHELDDKRGKRTVKKWTNDYLTEFKEQILIEYDINS